MRQVRPKMSDTVKILDIEPDAEEYDEEDLDDSDIPLSHVVHAAIGISVEGNGPNRHCTASEYVIEGEDGCLHAGAMEESIWAYWNDGQLWTAGSST
ncbi:hypothetical protein E4T56_gene18465 [Termitomyces sp. T112]|nr:hypothetical protein E4T56_gene18465 [Termitomyces sp. T112]